MWITLMRVFYAGGTGIHFTYLAANSPTTLLISFVHKAARYLFRNRDSIQLAYTQLPSAAPSACPRLKQSESLAPSGFQEMGNRCACVLESDETLEPVA